MPENEKNTDPAATLFSSINKIKPSEKIQEQIISGYHESQKRGWLDKIFGSDSTRSPVYIAFSICVLLIIIGIAVTCLSYMAEIMESVGQDIWDSILPIITLSLGYVFGKK